MNKTRYPYLHTKRREDIMQGRITVKYKDGRIEEYESVHYMNLNYDLKVATIGYTTGVNNLLIFKARIDLETVSTIIPG